MVGMLPSIISTVDLEKTRNGSFRKDRLGPLGEVGRAELEELKVVRFVVFLERTHKRKTYPPWKFNMAPENKPSQKESHLQTIIFQGRAVKLRGCRHGQDTHSKGERLFKDDHLAGGNFFSETPKVGWILNFRKRLEMTSEILTNTWGGKRVQDF